MNGVLFKYGPGSAHVAFKSSPQAPAAPTAHSPATPAVSAPTASPQAVAGGGELHLVLVGGLTDGLLFAPYAKKLAAAAGQLGWSLVQAQLTSSYQGWGLASLDQDASELHLLSQHLQAEHNCSRWVLMGHSTGCQDAVRYMQKYGQSDKALAGVILQAPVSDREYLSMFPAWQDKVAAAQQLVQEGRGEDVVYRVTEWDGAAVTARRLVSLCCKGGDDDMFSTDLSLQELQSLLGPMHTTSCLILQSGADESVPEVLRQSGAVQQLGQHMLEAVQLGCGSTAVAATAAEGGGAGGGASASGGSGEGHAAKERSSGGSVLHELRVIEGAGHACAGHEQQLVEAVCGFLSRLPVGGCNKS